MMAFVETRDSKLTVRIATVRDFHSMITVSENITLPRYDSDSQRNNREGYFGLTNTYMVEFNIVDKQMYMV